MADTPLKVAIIGTAPTSRDLAPYQDPSWQIWACSPGNQGGALPRVNIWFELHALQEMLSPEMRGVTEPYFAWLDKESRRGAFQVVMVEFNDRVPQAIPFPLQEMIERFGRNWFTSSVALMMALAIARGATEIGLWGVDMAADMEHYSGQRAGCTRFREIAEERGIKVTIPMESCLAAPVPIYGYSEGTPFGRRVNAVMVQVQGRRAIMQQQHDQLAREIAFFDGAMEQLRYFQRTWTDGSDMKLDLGALAGSGESPAVLKGAEAGRGGDAPATPAKEEVERLVGRARAELEEINGAGNPNANGGAYHPAPVVLSGGAGSNYGGAG